MKYFAIGVCALFLSGCFPAIFVGGSAAVFSAASNKTVGEMVDDKVIFTKIKAILTKEHPQNFMNITVDVFQGRVMYTGIVSNEDHITRAIDIAWQQRGVKEVINHLIISEPKSNKAQSLRDSWITAQIKARMASGGIKFQNYKVVTANNVVYLLGVAYSEEELEKATNVAATVEGVERVLSHVSILPPQNHKE